MVIQQVVLASVPDMECGFSRDLFIQWASNPKNSVIVTSRTSPGTLGRKLIDDPKKDSVFLEVRRRVRLEGADLEEHMRKEREKALEASRIKADTSKKDRDELESSDESDMEVDDELGPGLCNKTTKYDLMMKSEGKARTGFFKQAKKAYPLYPAPEDKIKWDDYGEVIRPDDYAISEIMPMEDENKEQSTVEADDPKEATEVPTKCVRQLMEIPIKCNVTFIDFEGRSDGESIKKILQQIKPRQLILVHGTEKATAALANYCRKTKDLVQGKVFTPDLNEIVDATKESHIYQVKLKDSLVSALSFYKARETELAWIDAMLETNAPKTDTGARHEENNKENGNGDDPDSMEVIPSLVPVGALQVRGHDAVFINEPRLSDFKLVLLREGISAEFQGGVLICNNVVAIRRTEAGKMQLEGCLSEEYFRIRDLLYGQYAIV